MRPATKRWSASYHDVLLSERLVSHFDATHEFAIAWPKTIPMLRYAPVVNSGSIRTYSHDACSFAARRTASSHARVAQRSDSSSAKHGYVSVRARQGPKYKAMCASSSEGIPSISNCFVSGYFG